MRFILVMDVLNSLVLKAELGLLQPLLSGGRGSHYMQTVWCLFMQPRDNELLLVKKKKKTQLFWRGYWFGHKHEESTITPIRCEAQQIEAVQQVLVW